MQFRSPPITPCLWFDDQAEEAARFYTSVFRDSSIGRIARYGGEGQDVHGKPEGSVMVVEFEINGMSFTALNGGPLFRFSEAISFQVTCETQEEIDYYWERLCEGGPAEAQRCGWLKDRYGLSWQIVPRILPKLVVDPDPDKAGRAMNAMLAMKKLDIDGLVRAWRGVAGD